MKSAISIFNELNEIPRGSGNEKAISDWLCKWALYNSFNYTQDAQNNVVIEIPGTGKFRESQPGEGYILQGHMDMVCQKTEDSTHDFFKDPIISIEKDGWLMTNGQTTLGADNGIGIAMALAIVLDKEIEHLPLELLFTVDEEQGLVGALNLSKDILKARKLINIDSEDEGVITIGCAGSRDTTFTKKYVTKKSIPEEMIICEISISGGKGGHSGIMIQNKIANAHVINARLLDLLIGQFDINLISWFGGKFRNAIPGESKTQILVDKADFSKIEKVVKDFGRTISNEYQTVEPNLSINITQISNENAKVLLNVDTREVINTVLSIPHGVLGMSNEVSGLVETSNNLAVVELNNGKLEIKTMHRSSVYSRLDEVTAKLNAIGKLINAEITHGNASPPWQPDANSNLLKSISETYERLYNKKPIVEAIHAGLECGVIGEKYPGMEMVSIGPTIQGAHTPKEKLELKSVELVGKWILEIISQ
jgi:dipeptidase D